MNGKEQRRAMILTAVVEGRLTAYWAGRTLIPGGIGAMFMTIAATAVLLAIFLVGAILFTGEWTELASHMGS